jgi:MFS family permease
MKRHFEFDIREYYRNLHLSRDLIFLYMSRLFMQVAVGSLSVFTAVYFYEQFDQSLTKVMLVFAPLYLLFVFLTPLSAMLIKRLGIKKLIISAVLFHPFAYISLLFWDVDQTLAIIGFIVFVTLYRSLYWAPYHIDFAKFTNKENRGKQMSLLLNLSEVMLTLTPIISGIIIASYGFNAMFGFSVVFMFISSIPLWFIRDTREVYSFGYLETFKKLFERENRSLALAQFGDGIQTAVRIAIWPIFIYLLLDGQYVAIGVVTSLTIFLLISLRFVLGNLEDKVDRRKLLRYGSFLSTTGWIIKIFIDTGFEIFVADTYHKVGRMVNRLTFDITTYDQASDNGHYIDEYTVLKEIAVNMGRGFMVLMAIWLTATFSIVATFVFAAVATLSMTLLHRDVYIQ